MAYSCTIAISLLLFHCCDKYRAMLQTSSILDSRLGRMSKPAPVCHGHDIHVSLQAFSIEVCCDVSADKRLVLVLMAAGVIFWLHGSWAALCVRLQD